MNTSPDIVKELVTALEEIAQTITDSRGRRLPITAQILETAQSALAAYHASVKDDGWKEWKGGECPPVDPHVRVEVRCRDGYEAEGTAGDLATDHNANWWDHTQDRFAFNVAGDCRRDDIIAWRLAK